MPSAAKRTARSDRYARFPALPLKTITVSAARPSSRHEPSVAASTHRRSRSSRPPPGGGRPAQAPEHRRTGNRSSGAGPATPEPAEPPRRTATNASRRATAEYTSTRDHSAARAELIAARSGTLARGLCYLRRSMLRRKRSRYARSEKLFAAASRILPGGVDSPVRAFKAVGGTPVFVARAQGAHIVDVDGNTYVDYVMSWGPLIHGHAPKGLRKALAAAAAHGTSFGAPDRARNAARRTRREPHAFDGADPIRQLWHRGGDERAARRPRGDGVRPHREVRRAATTGTPTRFSCRPDPER